MKAVLGLALLGLSASTVAATDRLCDAATTELRRLARDRSLEVDVRCRPSGNRPVSPDAEVTGLPWPDLAIRGGPLSWPVRVREGGQSYVQRVLLSAQWTAPAWVARRNLDPGQPLQDGDVEIQPRVWPAGLNVKAAQPSAMPQGRLKQAMRAGELLPASALWAPGTLLRGDPVVAVLAEGATEIRINARLLAPAKPGERARVQAAGRSAVLEGTVMDLNTVKVVTQ